MPALQASSWNGNPDEVAVPNPAEDNFSVWVFLAPGTSDSRP